MSQDKNLSFAINGRIIGGNSAPFIIAEMSANHNGEIDRAFKIIEAAKLAGADAVKIQTYTADSLTLNSDREDFQITEGIWSGQTLYKLYESAQMPWEWHEALFAKARDVGITLFSSPFDNAAVDLLETLETPAYKIASFEAIDLPLIDYVARTGKPMIISTGMANEHEIAEAQEVAYKAGCKDLAILHCVSGYPTPASEYNLETIRDMQDRFEVLTGLSDHTLGNATAIASVAVGAKIIEKHFTLDADGGGADDSFSIMPEQLSQLVDDCKTVWSAMGEVNYERKESEESNSRFRRSLYFVENISAGTRITEEHVKSIRPGFGLAPKHYWGVLGKRVTKNIFAGTRVSWELIEE